MSIHYTHEKRYTKTISFVNKHIKKGSNILDLGIKNILSERLISSGYVVENTKGENLDIDFNAYSKKNMIVSQLLRFLSICWLLLIS